MGMYFNDKNSHLFALNMRKGVILVNKEILLWSKFAYSLITSKLK
jgi:hypothetical protein